MIELPQLEEMFANMRETPGWQVDGPLLWGYFFTDTSPQKLEKAGIELQRLGYQQVEIWLAEEDEDDNEDEGEGGDGADGDYESSEPVDLDEIDDDGPVGEVYFLHVEKVEQHTPQSLHQRNAELYALAAKLGLGSYDGMDVGPVKAD